jgi:hypothetical protein
MKTISPLLILGFLGLGLAPFSPPHVFGKIQWVMGGAVGMEAKDWFDLFFHGIPLLLAIIIIIMVLLGKWKIVSK